MQHAEHRPFETPAREHARKEWGCDDDREHQTQAREHARLGGRADFIRMNDAATQIRELHGCD